MVGHGLVAQSQFIGHFAGRAALGEQAEHLELARRQGAYRSGAAPGNGLLSQTPGDFRFEVTLAASDYNGRFYPCLSGSLPSSLSSACF